jgi:hypothetical protein
MATSFVSTSSDSDSSSYSVYPVVPAGVQDGDLLVAFVGGVAADTSASGWTYLGGISEFRGFFKVANSESGTYTFNQVVQGPLRAQVVAYRGGFDTSDPIDANSSAVYGYNNDVLKGGTVSPTLYQNETLIFFGGCYRTSAVTFSTPENPITFTEDVNTGDTTGDMWCLFAHGTWYVDGASGDIDSTMSVSTPNKQAFVLALNPKINVSNPILAAMSF